MNSNSTIAERVFLVGCARSGTTLLQSILGTHSRIATFPESHFFQHAVPGRNWAKRMGLASRAARGQLNRFLEEAGHPELKSSQTLPIESLRGVAEVFIQDMDMMTAMENKDIWLEKTPGHLYHIPIITRLAPKSRFIHIVRSGKDVVSSLYAVTREHEGAYGHPMEIDECIYWWKEAIDLSANYLHHPNHFFMRYERLTKDTKTTVATLCDFLQIEFQDRMLSDYPDVAKRVALPSEPWKANTSKKIHTASRFDEIFTPEQQKYILEQLQSSDAQISDWGIPETHLIHSRAHKH